MPFIFSLLILNICLSSRLAQAECPHKKFLETHICDDCRDWTQVTISSDSRNNLHDNFHDSLQVLKHQVSVAAKGITAVMGPPVHSFPPLFRQNGPYSKYRQFCHHWWFIFPSDLCINRQARPAYRCNMKAKRPYCFKVNAIESEYVCRSGVSTCLGFQQMLRGPPSQHRGVLQGLGQDGAHTLRGWLHLGEVTH